MNYSDVARNINAFPADKLRQYEGKYVAWSEDGTAILAAADDIGGLIDAVDAKYPIGTEFTIDYVPAGPYANDPEPPPGTPLGQSQNGTAP